MVVKQKSSILFVVLLLIFSLLVGCSSQTVTGKDQNSESTTQSNKPVEIE